MSSSSYLPVPNPTLSYWRSSPHPLDNHRSTSELPTSQIFDILIIGAGMSGVSVLYEIASQPPSSSSSPPPTALLLDARGLCSGATGRNGGHIKIKPATLAAAKKRFSPQEMAVYAALADEQVGAIKEVVEKERIECEFELRRTFDVYLQDKDVEKAAERWRDCEGEKWMRSRSWVGGHIPNTAEDKDKKWGKGEGEAEAEAEERRKRFVEGVTGVRGAAAAVSGPACSFWPYKLVTGLLERAMEKMGERVNVQMHTPVLEVVEEEEKGGEGKKAWLVRTERGEVRARKVVFCTNAYTPGLLPQYEKIIRPVKGTAARLAPPEGGQRVFPPLSHTYNIEYGLREDVETVNYINPRPDGGIVLGGASWLFRDRKELWQDTVDDSTLLEPVIEAGYFDSWAQRTFRGWEDSGTVVDKVWTGIMGVTPDGIPHVGQVPGTTSQWILAGFNGGGMPQIFLLAKAIAKMVLEGTPLEESDEIVPRFFKTTYERLDQKW